MKERDKEMTKTIKHIVTSFLPSLREGLGVGFLLLLGGAGGGLLSSCSSSDDAVTESLGAEDAIVLGVKEVKTPETRSQHTGSMNFTELKGTGFGVYGYEVDGTYNSASSAPSLFSTGANTHVTFIAGGTDPTTTVVHPGNWEYAASSANVKPWVSGKKYTFFAYAPWMSAGEGTQGTNAGINTISTGNGDPTIAYTVASDPAESVDLLWGIRSDNGLPWKDVTSATSAGTVMFTFYHALCAIGYHAQVMVDKDNNLSDAEDESGIAAIGTDCKVTIKSITFEPNDANSKPGLFYQTGTLNLNNSTPWTPSWGSLSGSIASLVLDGDKIDSKILDPAPADASAINAFLDDNTNHPGVTQAANSQAVITKDGSGNERFYMLLPYAAKDYKLTIKYFITYKTGAGTYFRSDELTGNATLSDMELKPGIKYYLNMVFGLTTFKLSVLAYDWDGQTINTSVVVENGTSASQSLAKEWR